MKVFLVLAAGACAFCAAGLAADPEDQVKDAAVTVYSYPLTYREKPIGYEEHPHGWREFAIGYREKPIGFRELPLNYTQHIHTRIDPPPGFSATPPGFKERERHHLVNEDPSLRMAEHPLTNPSGDLRITVKDHPQTSWTTDEGQKSSEEKIGL